MGELLLISITDKNGAFRADNGMARGKLPGCIAKDQASPSVKSVW